MSEHHNDPAAAETVTQTVGTAISA